MKTYTPEQRLQNMLNRAIELGYTVFDLKNGMSAEEYIIECDPTPLHEIHEGSPNLWSDGMGYTQEVPRSDVKTEWWRTCCQTRICLEFVVNSEGKQVKLYEKRTFDVMYIQGESVNAEGFHESYLHCLEFIKKHNGTDGGHFPQYIGGEVFIYCYETEQNVYTEKVIDPQNPDSHRIKKYLNASSILKRFINLWSSHSAFFRK